MKNYVVRINLKTDIREGGSREALMNVCLGGEQKYLAIGWSYLYDKNPCQFNTYEELYQEFKASRTKGNRTNPVLNIFKEVEEGDLFWTRDLDGFYWICRAMGGPETKYDWALDIGAVVPVQAYQYGLEVPGGIKASFKTGVLHVCSGKWPLQRAHN